MTNRVKFSRVQTQLDELSYPIQRGDAAETFSDTVVVFADGEANLGELVDDISDDSFADPEELYVELQNVVPVEAVGEPGQSEGDA